MSGSFPRACGFKATTPRLIGFGFDAGAFRFVGLCVADGMLTEAVDTWVGCIDGGGKIDGMGVRAGSAVVSSARLACPMDWEAAVDVEHPGEIPELLGGTAGRVVGIRLMPLWPNGPGRGASGVAAAATAGPPASASASTECLSGDPSGCGTPASTDPGAGTEECRLVNEAAGDAIRKMPRASFWKHWRWYWVMV